MTERIVLQAPDITRALTRISHEILESNRGGANLVILGIPTRGVILAERIGALLESIEPGSGSVGSLDVTMYRDDLAGQPTRAPSPTRLPAGVSTEKRLFWLTMSCTPVAQSAPLWMRSTTTGDPARCDSLCSSIAGIANCRFEPTLWEKTSPPPSKSEFGFDSPKPMAPRK